MYPNRLSLFNHITLHQTVAMTIALESFWRPLSTPYYFREAYSFGFTRATFFPPAKISRRPSRHTLVRVAVCASFEDVLPSRNGRMSLREGASAVTDTVC